MTKLFAALVALLAVVVIGALASPAAAAPAIPPTSSRSGRWTACATTTPTSAPAGRSGARSRCDAGWKPHRPGCDWGIYNCRTTRTGGSLSLHAEGRAIDWHLDARTRSGLRAGNKLVALLLADDMRGRHFALARRMGVQEIIWDCRIWSAKHPRMSRYSACDSTSNVTVQHRDHVHIGLSWKGARKLTTFWHRVR